MFNKKSKKEAYDSGRVGFFGRVGRESSEGIGIWLEVHEKFMQANTCPLTASKNPWRETLRRIVHGG
jgi:hypothetical protein